MKKEIWQNEELLSAIKIFIISILMGAFCAYIGYSFCMDNEYNPVKGVVFGFLLPFIYGAVHNLIEWIRGKEPYWLVTAFLVLVLSSFSTYIPVWIGIIAIALLLYIEILQIRIAYHEAKKEKKTVQLNVTKNNPQEEIKMWKDEAENTEIEFLEAKFYCERCFEKISQEEYEGNDGMCEECYEDVCLENRKE